MPSPPLRVIDIIEGTSADGPGLRTSIYFAGCAHHCPGCHNPSTWPFETGIQFSSEDLGERIKSAGWDVTFSGGDPLYQSAALLPLARYIKHHLNKDLWIYTGFTFEEIIAGQAGKDAIALLDFTDTLVDGPFIESLRDENLLFRGSANQRIINVARTLSTGQISIRHELTDSLTPF